MIYPRKIGSVLAAAALCLLAAGAQAQIENGGFEGDGYFPWIALGENYQVTAEFGSGPVEGSQESFSHTGGTFSPVPVASLETFFGLAPGDLNRAGDPPAVEGSGIKQTFNAQAGDVVKFQWNFLTTESTPATNNDYAFFTLALGAGTPSVSVLADTNAAFVNSSAFLFTEETGFHSLSVNIPVTGAYTLGFGVVDVGNILNDSGLLVDNVRLVTAVPEPGSVAMLAGMGLSGAAVLFRRRRRA